MQITEHREDAFHDVTNVLIFGDFTTSQALKKNTGCFFAGGSAPLTKIDLHTWPITLMKCAQPWRMKSAYQASMINHRGGSILSEMRQPTICDFRCFFRKYINF